MKIRLSTMNNAMFVQNQLLTYEKDELKKLYETEGIDIVESFIDGCIFLLEKEKQFFLLEEGICNKVLNIISLVRFEYREYNQQFNKIIVEMNKLSNLPKNEKIEMSFDYLKYQERNRNTELNMEKAACCICYDSILFDIIENGCDHEIDNITMLIASINYFLNVYPGFFKDNERRKTLENIVKAINENYELDEDDNIKEYIEITKDEMRRLLK